MRLRSSTDVWSDHTVARGQTTRTRDSDAAREPDSQRSARRARSRRIIRSDRGPRPRGARLRSMHGRDGDEERARVSAVPVTIGVPRRGTARLDARARALDRRSTHPARRSSTRYGRVHRDLRISLTDRCSLRCTYCMPEQGNEWLARIEHPDPRRDRARRAGRRGRRRHDVPAHRRRAAAAHRHRRGRAPPRRDRRARTATRSSSR